MLDFFRVLGIVGALAAAGFWSPSLSPPSADPEDMAEGRSWPNVGEVLKVMQEYALGFVGKMKVTKMAWALRKSGKIVRVQWEGCRAEGAAVGIKRELCSPENARRRDPDV